MSRNLILVAGAFLWSAVAVDAVVHLASGDWLAPALMAVAAIVFVAVRGPRRVQRRASDGSPSW
jgi:dihydroxyacid dehydratase/phosphogluconate dehydratase